MEKLQFDSTNPVVFFGLMASAIFFIGVSIFAIFILGFLVFVALGDPLSNSLIQIAGILIVCGMIGIGVWNIIDSVKLISEMRVRLLGWIVARSILALLPLGILVVLSEFT